ncbi:N-lysine methyltransferase KMT5A-A-like [Magallana gigas]|uniref:N-lysine methyltransferase KMT5A-A-like n=1 Tax=Magallana gigas TaxID=29159 RepID=UPI00333F92F8
MLKASLIDRGDCKKSRLSPDAEAKIFCEAGLDKDGFDVKYLSDYKGFGVISTTVHASGDFLLQYAGETLNGQDGEERLKRTTENKIFFYRYKGKELCIDAEGVNDHICQFVNDGKDDANSTMKLKVYNGREYLCLFAKRDIVAGEEILYDYGCDGKNLWWRSKFLLMWILTRLVCQITPQVLILNRMKVRRF